MHAKAHVWKMLVCLIRIHDAKTHANMVLFKPRVVLDITVHWKGQGCWGHSGQCHFDVWSSRWRWRGGVIGLLRCRRPWKLTLALRSSRLRAHLVINARRTLALTLYILLAIPSPRHPHLQNATIAFRDREPGSLNYALKFNGRYS